MVRLVWRTDVHLSDQGPIARKDDWATTVLGKLRQVGLVAGKVGADAVLDGGDFFHIKSPLQNSHALIRRTAEVHAAYPCPVYANVGNHDCVWGDYSYLPQQPLGVLFATGVFRRCYDEHEVVFERDGVKVRVVGVPYHGTTYDLERFRRIRRGDEDHLVCIAHVLASEKGGSMFEGEDILRYQNLLEFEPTCFAFGHWHKDQGVTDIGGGKTVINIGSLTRGSLAQDDVARQPSCAIMTFAKGSPVDVKVVRLNVGAASEVFDIEGRRQAEKRAETLDSFVESVRARITTPQGIDVRETVRGLPIAQAVRERALALLERATQEGGK